uniref:Armadillo repeat containing 10 n=1 Tax=Sphenodon punctatus TaxID=8508 RepID=A0A8D0H776_SPHPU
MSKEKGHHRPPLGHSSWLSQLGVYCSRCLGCLFFLAVLRGVPATSRQDLIRNLDGLSVIGKTLSDPTPKVKEKALNAFNNLSMNIKNQEEIKVYIIQICEEVDSSSLNSDLQLAGLRLLTNMSVTNNYHHLMTNSIPCFLHLLLEGSERIQIQVLKVLVNISANPAMTGHLLSAQAPSLLSLFTSCINREILLRMLVFVTNLIENMKTEEATATQHQYNKDSFFSVLWGDSTQYAQKLALLLHHHDMEVREQVAKIITMIK